MESQYRFLPPATNAQVPGNTVPGAPPERLWAKRSGQRSTRAPDLAAAGSPGQKGYSYPIVIVIHIDFTTKHYILQPLFILFMNNCRFLKLKIKFVVAF